MPLWTPGRDLVVGRLDREEVQDRRGADEMRGAAAVAGRVGDACPGAIGIWPASVVELDVATSPSPSRCSCARSRDMSSSLAGRSSGGRCWRRRLARSLSRFLRLMPMIGANSLLLAKVPFSMMSVAGLKARNPRRQSVSGRSGPSSRRAPAACRSGRCGSRTSCHRRRGARRRRRASGTRVSGCPCGHGFR